jgi:hypothetical protein
MRQFHGWALWLSLMLFAQLTGLRAENVCSVSDYRGTYAFHGTGAFVDLPPEAAPLAGPFAQAGTFTSDGQGNLVIESIPSFNGFIAPSAQDATYTITPDCVITFSLVLPIVDVPTTFLGVLSSANRQMNLMVVDPPGTVISGEHAKQDLRFCGVGDFSGAYQIDLTGSRVAPLERPGLFHRSGRLVSDGQGSFTASTIANYAGYLVQEDFDGTYTMTPRCTLELHYTYGGQEYTVTGYMAGHGEEVEAVVPMPGWAVAGSLRSQQ